MTHASRGLPDAGHGTDYLGMKRAWTQRRWHEAMHTPQERRAILEFRGHDAVARPYATVCPWAGRQHQANDGRTTGAQGVDPGMQRGGGRRRKNWGAVESGSVQVCVGGSARHANPGRCVKTRSVCERLHLAVCACPTGGHHGARS
ncbi:hypothetical protein IEO21_03912 [Rhodonia placenta]|uniref:Uncharacterized protein n=1 Tax=Rhodonia placenta TaxID=104341 RepID=A0A8H7U3Q0_9APHY|nr:hypothetical protein IEO21_03912 [Postia placenta]